MYLHYIRYISNDIYSIFLVLHPSEINVLKMFSSFFYDVENSMLKIITYQCIMF